MSTQYDENNWLVTLDRALHDYVTAWMTAKSLTLDVEMSFPNTREFSKEMPLARPLIHFEQDDLDNPVWGFGFPGKEVWDETDPDNPTFTLEEAQVHMVNYDVGIWVSAEAGGSTKRNQIAQELVNLFCPATAKKALQEATNGIWVVSFDRGQNEIDRINDIPIWRRMSMELIVRVYSRHVGQEEVVATEYDQDQQVTIANELGTQVPIV